MKALRMCVLLGTAAVTGCAGTATSQVGSVPAGAPSAVGVREDALSLLGPGPDKRQGCNVTQRHVIKSGGGAFPVPACSGWSGTIGYPPGNHRYIFGVTGSVTNDFGAPPPPSGTAIFYMHTNRVQPHISPSFGDTTVTDTVSSPELTSDHTYTLIVYGFFLDPQCPSPPPTGCPPWSANIGSPAPSTNSITFVSPFNGAVVVGSSTWQFVQN